MNARWRRPLRLDQSRADRCAQQVGHHDLPLGIGMLESTRARPTLALHLRQGKGDADARERHGTPSGLVADLLQCNRKSRAVQLQKRQQLTVARSR